MLLLIVIVIICLILFTWKKDSLYVPFTYNGRSYLSSSFNHVTRQVDTPGYRDIVDETMNTPDIKSVLLLGVCMGGVMIDITNHSDVFVTGVDISDEYFDIAKKYSDPDKIRLIKDDANNYVAQTDETYDVVIIDIFNGVIIPDFVFSEEFMNNIRRITKIKYIINLLFRQNVERLGEYSKLTANNIATVYV